MGLLDVPSYSRNAADALLKTNLANALVPRPAFLPRKPEYVIANFANGHGWTATGPWASSNLNDTSQQGWADQVISGVTDGAGGGCNFQKIGGFTAFDPTGKHMTLFMKVSAPTRIASVVMYLSSEASSSFTNHSTWTALGGSGQLLQPNEWFPVIFTADGAGTAGTGSGAAIQAMRLRIADKGAGQPITIALGGVSQYERSDKNPYGVVTICTDDGWASHATTVKTALSKYRYRASAFPIIELLGTPGYTTEEQFLNLGRAHGWEIGAHCSSLAIHQAGFTSLSTDALRSELLTIRRWLTDRGLPSQTLAYPQSLYNPEVLAEARKLFAVGRTTDGAQKEVFPPADPMRIRSLSLTTSPAVSLATAKAAVDNAQTFGHHLVITVHDIVASAPTGANWLLADFVALIDYIATKLIPVKPLGEVLAGA